MNFDVIELMNDYEIYEFYDDIIAGYYCACSGNGINGFCWPDGCPIWFDDTTPDIFPGYTRTCTNKCTSFNSQWTGYAWSTVSCNWGICRK